MKEENENDQFKVVTYTILLTHELDGTALIPKLRAWKTTGRGWQPACSAPPRLRAELSLGDIVVKNAKVGNYGQVKGEVEVIKRVSRQAMWKRRKKVEGQSELFDETSE
jgi:hypothetical protein